MKKFNISAKKKIILFGTSISSLISFGFGYASYLISSEINKSLNINPINLEVIDSVQNLITYINKSNLKTSENYIVEDNFSMELKFNNSDYLKALNGSLTNKFLMDLYNNSGLKVIVTFQNLELFEFVKNNVGNSFIDLSYQNGMDAYRIKIDNSKRYLANNVECFQYKDKQIIFSISINQNFANSSFYVYKLAEEASLNNFDGYWNFFINLNFDIVDEYYGYCLNESFATIEKFGNVNVSIELESYLG